MFRYSSIFFSRWLLCLTMFGSAPGVTAELTITTTNDAVGADGFCSLREAMLAISTRTAVEECPAGTGIDTVVLEEGAKYQLGDDGALVLGGYMTTGDNPQDIVPTAIITVTREDAFDDEPKEHPVIFSPLTDRAFDVRGGSRLVLDEITVDGDDPDDPTIATGVSGDGGLILADGGVTLTNRAKLLRGQATGSGGAIFLQGEKGLNIEDASITYSSAGVNGGAIATTPSFPGALNITRGYFAYNTAAQAGGGIFLDGSFPLLQIANSTFFGNSSAAALGAAVRLEAGSRGASFNNVTIAGNDGGGAISFNTVSSVAVEELLNSVIVGNIGGSCVGDRTAIDNANIVYVVHEVVDTVSQTDECTLDADAFVPDPNGSGLPGDDISNNSSTANFTVLRGDVDPDPAVVTEGTCANVLGSAGCQPLAFEAGWPGFMPDRVDDIGDLTDSVPTVLDAGSPRGAAYPCLGTDQREETREFDCDAGAVELVIAKGRTDEFFVVQGIVESLDVAENDVGDVALDCTPVVPISDCVTILIPPRKGTVEVVYDADGYPTINYQSYPGIHGVDVFNYSISRAAVEDGLTYLDADLGAQVNVVVEPASGLAEDSIGSWGPGYLVALALGILGRRRRRTTLLAGLVVLPLAGQAAEITVNGMGDSLTPDYTDGICTLREALGNAIDESPVISPDCSFGAIGKDVIMLPEGSITLVGPLRVLEGSVEIVGQGAVVPGVTGTTIDANGDRAFIAESFLALKDLTLRNAASSGDGAAIFTNASLTLERTILENNASRAGGAVFLNYTGNRRRTAKLSRSEFRNNSASRHGGALALVVQNEAHSVIIDGVTFRENQASTTGGAIDVNLADGSLYLVNSTFYANSATNGDPATSSWADAIDLADVTQSIYIINSTFVQHANGAIDVGPGVNVDNNADGDAIDDGEEQVFIELNNSLYISSGYCSSSSGRLFGRRFNAFGAPVDGTCTALNEEGNEDGATHTDLLTILGNAPVAAAGEKEDFVPSHFAIDRAAADANRASVCGTPPADGCSGYIVDAGNGAPSELDAGYQNPAVCRAVDLRGSSRQAGNVCDRGAYELNRVTAVPDSGKNASQRGRYAIIDVLANDLSGDPAETVVTTSIDVDVDDVSGDPYLGSTPAQAGFPGGGTLRVVQREDIDTECNAASTAEDPTDCVVRYDAPAGLSCGQVDEFQDSFQYQIQSSNGEISEPGDVKVFISNVAPRADNVTLRAEPGEVVVFPFTVDDPDDAEDLAVTGLVEFALTVAPLNARYQVVDGDPVYLGVGIVVDQLAGTVTYHPASELSPFDEKFTLTYKDDCGGSGSTTFIVDYPHSYASGDVTTGRLSFIGLTGLLLLALRRRRLQSF